MNTTTRPTVNLTDVDLQTYELALLSAIEKAEDNGYITGGNETVSTQIHRWRRLSRFRSASPSALPPPRTKTAKPSPHHGYELFKPKAKLGP